jgi:hypothetical protein
MGRNKRTREEIAGLMMSGWLFFLSFGPFERLPHGLVQHFSRYAIETINIGTNLFSGEGEWLAYTPVGALVLRLSRFLLSFFHTRATEPPEKQ